MAEKLKPCPFCGGDVKIINAEELTINHHRSGGEQVMKTCKECIHYEVCRALCKSKEELMPCVVFKYRSHFVELPCKLGDFVYFIKARRVMADVVSKFTIDRRGVMLQRANGYNLGYTDQRRSRAGVEGA